MTIAAAVVSTFPNFAWPIYAEAMLQTFTAYWPQEIPLLVALDDDSLYHNVINIIRPQDAVSTRWLDEHKAFVERNKDKDHPSDYRKQAVRFCHKVFAIKQALNAIEQMEHKPRYLIWMDADVITTRPVSLADIERCLPKEGDAIAYLGRKDWDHSECGWLAFDLENGGNDLINNVVNVYISNEVFNQLQLHDSWIWDVCIKDFQHTNLTQDKPGNDIWPHSPMASWSKHYKGPVAKQDLIGIKPQKMKQVPLNIQTRNSIPDEKIKGQIAENQAQITNWVQNCFPHDEEIVVVSAGPMLLAEDLEEEVKAGRKIVAVKHALEPLKAAGIKPWACILLDPRDHLYKFVENPDTDIIWFVASQVHPPVVKKLLDSGCTVWGYHASVGAGEDDLIKLQESAIIPGGSATATRGLYLLETLGFKKFRLYGYDLCLPDKPNMDEKDDMGQPKYFEISLEVKTHFYNQKRMFWSKPELIAQYQEMNAIIEQGKWQLEAFGQGVVPYLVNAKRVSDLRQKKKKSIIDPVDYKELLYGPNDRAIGTGCDASPATDTRRTGFIKRLFGCRTASTT